MVDDFSVPDDVLLVDTHEYVRMIDDDRVRIGISGHAADQLGDIVFVELPEVGDTFEKGESFGSIESVKAASDLYVPVSGEVTAVNDNLAEEPGVINDSPFDSGWMIEMVLSNVDELKELLTPDQYAKAVEES